MGASRGRECREGIGEGPGAGPTWPVGSGSRAVCSGCTRSGPCPCPPPARKRDPPPRTTGPGSPGSPGCVRLGLPGAAPSLGRETPLGRRGGAGGGPGVGGRSQLAPSGAPRPTPWLRGPPGPALAWSSLRVGALGTLLRCPGAGGAGGPDELGLLPSVRRLWGIGRGRPGRAELMGRARRGQGGRLARALENPPPHSRPARGSREQGLLHTTLPGGQGPRSVPRLSGGWLPLPSLFPCGQKAARVPAQA